MIETKHALRILPIHVINPRKNKEESIYAGEELESLIHTLGGEIVDRVVQQLEKPNNATYIGKGKVHEVEQIVRDKEIDVVILNAMVKPGQIHNLKKEKPGIEVWDRVDLILQIFDKHATTTEAKLQRKRVN